MAFAEIQLPAEGIPTGPLSEELLEDKAIERALCAVRDHLGVEIAFVSRYIENGQREITHLHTELELPMAPGFRENVEDSYCWHILEGRLPELIRDSGQHGFAKTLAITETLPVGCHLNVPLRLSDGSVWGSFCAIGRTVDHSLGQRDLNVVRAFAGLAAERVEDHIKSDMEIASAHARVEEMLDGHAITIFQQPIHALDTGEPVGVECLARFPNTKKRGPGDWFEDAEKVGLGVELELAAVRNAIETLVHVPEGKYAAINVSPATILSGALEAELEAIDGSRLVIEVTEHQKVEDYDALSQMLERLKAKTRIAIDDVGTGYSGLRHIVDLKPDILKMDMALTRDIDSDPARRALTGALVQLSRDIGCKLVAEGIETFEECQAMAALGVDYGQGYYFARPLPVVAAQQHMLGQRDEEDAPDVGADELRGMPEEDDQPELRSNGS